MTRYLDAALDQPEQMRCSAMDKMVAKLSLDQNLKMRIKSMKAADGFLDFAATVVHELTHTKPGGRTDVSAQPPNVYPYSSHACDHHCVVLMVCV